MLLNSNYNFYGNEHCTADPCSCDFRLSGCSDYPNLVLNPDHKDLVPHNRNT